MFVDRVKIRVKAGDGGNGAVSFRREKYVEYGGPDGGDGGDGGDVVLVASKDVQDLTDLYFQPHIVAKRGEHGRSKGRTGRSAPPVVLKVPIGTEVYRIGPVVRAPTPSRYHPAAATAQFDAKAQVGVPYGTKSRRGLPSTGLTEPVTEPTDEERELLCDLVEDGQRFVLAHGGRGGRGNEAFKSSTHRAPREFEYGQPGEQLVAELVLKTIADVGLVGFPNAGKSTLISKITDAHPKIAPYPFTTLTPNVGVLVYEDYTRIRIADIPGLIEGAHAGRGLGHDFLQHIERCQLLVLLIDMAGVDGRKPWEDYRQLLKELELYDPSLVKKPRLVVANKMDLPAAKKNLVTFRRHYRGPLLAISAQTGEGLDKFVLALREAAP
ncbi:MAG: GTPase ObgE [Verrucomicrobiae bacterium]|nr:GTPase ObgE [Verrucomicrobiae bacterium]MDW8342910.1 GTPase ObgE [Verrucomicrobiae bacterium]